MTKRLLALGLLAILLFTAITSAMAGGEYKVSTSGGHLNMRSSASPSSTVILYIPNNTPVDDRGSVSGDWRKIWSWGYKSGQTSGYHTTEEGWVMHKFLVKN